MNRPWTTRIASFVPVWLSRRPAFQWAAKFLWALAFMSDRAAQVALEGMRAGWPGYDGRTDNLSLIGQSRGLVQGESESATAFARRLRQWLTSSVDLGGDVSLGRALLEWLGNRPMIRIWNRAGRCTTVGGAATVATLSAGVATITGLASMMNAMVGTGLWLFDTAISTNAGFFRILSVLSSSSVTIAVPSSWTIDANSGALGWAAQAVHSDGTPIVAGGLDWDSISSPERAEFWWDHWIVVYPDENPYPPAINNGDRMGVIPVTDPRRQVGIGHLCTRLQNDTLLGLVNQCKGQHAVIRFVVWTTNAALFDPSNPSAAGNPNGRWGVPVFWGTCPSDTVGSGLGLWPSRRRSDCRYWEPGA